MTAVPSPMAFDALPLDSRRVVALPVEPGGEHAPYDVPVHVLTGKAHRPRVVITAGIHGDEFEGVRACSLLLQALKPDDLQGTLVILPVAHPPAHAACARVSPLDSGDLNRSFPDDTNSTPTRRLAAALMASVVAGADFLIDLHSGGTRTRFAPMVGYREMPSGGASLAAAVAFGLSWLWAIPDQAGVFTREAAVRGVPGLGMEAGGSGGLRPEDVRVLHDGVLRVLRHLGLLPGATLDVVPAGPLSVYGGDWTLSPATGLWVAYVELGEIVRMGGLLAEIVAPSGETLASVRAPHDGMVAAIRTFGVVDEGEWGVMVLARDGEAEARAA